MIWINWRLVQIWTLCTLLGIAAFSVSGCGKMQRGWRIEPPPPQYASGPTQTGHTTELRVTPEQANYLCHVAGVWQHEPQGFPVACYNPRTDQVIVPDPKLWPSATEWRQMDDHEWGHARGERHNDDGTGAGPASLPPKAFTDPGFAPNDPANPNPIYAGPPPAAFGFASGPPIIITAQATPAQTGPMTTPPVPQGTFGFSARQAPGS